VLHVPHDPKWASSKNLEELIAVVRWFGIPEAMQLDAPEDYAKVPGLSLEEAIALVSGPLSICADRGYFPDRCRAP
jgi:hypothetical protein